MKPGTTWVERGPDGRPYYVRKKTKLPSATGLISSAYVPRRSHSTSFQLPFSRAFRKDFHIIPVEPAVSAPLAIEATPFSEHTTTSQTSPQSPLMMYPYQPFQAPFQDASNAQQLSSDGAKKEPQRYPAPHPNMYPIPPPPMTAFPTQPLPVAAYQQQPLPPGARVISPPRFATADELKYKCSVCGRFRSPRYHYRNPIPPGELPRATVCRRCREEATDSEDSDSYDERRLPRARSRSLVRVKSRNGPARSPSRSYDVLRRRRSRHRSPSASRNTRRVRIIEEELPPQHRSPVVDMVRYVEPRPQRTTSTTETVYVERDRGRWSGSSFEDDLYLVSDDEYHCPPRTRRISRAPTPTPRIVRRQYSDPHLPRPAITERREYFDGPTSVVDERALVRPSRPASRASSRNYRFMEEIPRRPRIRGEESRSEEEYSGRPASRRQYFEEEDWYANRGKGQSRSRHDRSRSRMSTYDDGEKCPVRRRSLLRAPTPPLPVGSSSLGYIDPRPYNEEVEVGRTRLREAIDHRRRPATVIRRRRSRSRSIADDQAASSFLRPGDNITVIERTPDPAQEYDWYDKDGMKVRVREI